MLLLCMQVYTEATDGSYLDVKESALVWHYKDADPDFGRWQAKVCCAASTNLTEFMPQGTSLYVADRPAS